MSEARLDLMVPENLSSSILQIKDLQQKITEKEHRIKTSKHIYCPICQNGFLQEQTRGKLLGIISDQWLICSQCKAEFDKQLKNATLKKISSDPYGIGKAYINKTLPIEEWKNLPLKTTGNDRAILQEKIDNVQKEINKHLSEQLATGKINIVLADLSSFIWKKDEKTIFAVPAVILEEQKTKIRQKVGPAGPTRSYGGFTFRVAKGVYYHTGRSRPISPPSKTITTEEIELVPADEGPFIITNQRIYFLGKSSKAKMILLSKISALHTDQENNILSIMQDNRKPVLFKVQTSFTTKISDIEFNIDIDFDQIIKALIHQ